MLGAPSGAGAQVLGPGPKATQKPDPKPPLSLGGELRAYSFQRANANGEQTRDATNFSALIHADYRFEDSGLSLGATYVGAYPFGINGSNPQFLEQIDNTLPGATLSAFPETYLKYAKKHLTAVVGNQFYNEKWMPSSDARLKPAAYQAILASYQVIPHLTVSVVREIRWENRTSSAFTRNTLLTSNVLGQPPHPEIDTPGTLLANVAYTTPRLSALLENYQFYDIANLVYGELHVNLYPSKLNPFINLQAVAENNIGTNVLGQIHAHTYGAQLGFNLTPQVTATFGYDGSPTVLSATPTYFRSVKLGPGEYATGSLASPFTDFYVTDPLYTDSLTDGPIELEATRNFKVGLEYKSPDKRLDFYATRAYYENVAYAPGNTINETDGDVTYLFMPVGKGAYKGHSIRERIGFRNEPFTPKNPAFTYIRSQLQYTF